MTRPYRKMVTDLCDGTRPDGSKCNAFIFVERKNMTFRRGGAAMSCSKCAAGLRAAGRIVIVGENPPDIRNSRN